MLNYTGFILFVSGSFKLNLILRFFSSQHRRVNNLLPNSIIVLNLKASKALIRIISIALFSVLRSISLCVPSTGHLGTELLLMMQIAVAYRQMDIHVCRQLPDIVPVGSANRFLFGRWVPFIVSNVTRSFLLGKFCHKYYFTFEQRI